MNVKELIEVLSKVPQDFEVEVTDFEGTGDFSDIFIVEKHNVIVLSLNGSSGYIGETTKITE